MEHELQPYTITVGIGHCKGTTSIFMDYGQYEQELKAKNFGELMKAQLSMSDTHDKLIHPNSEPCRKSFFIKP